MPKFLEGSAPAVLCLLALIVAAVLLLNAVLVPTMSRVEWQRETYHVKSGDSLWTISRDYCPDNVDRREWIYEVQSINGLTSSFIYPGQQLIVLAVKEG